MFVCHRGSYKPTVMFFGLCNSPATFQTMMNEIFADMEDVVVIYIDNIMIFTKGSLAEHQAKVKEVLQRLRDNLFTHPEKCSFDKTEVEYLGMFVNRDGIRMDNSKVKVITNWPTPTTVCGVRSFLGLANFYRHFIKDYAMLAKPLTDLTQKDKAFTWGSMEANMFASLKTCFTTAPILAYPDNDCQFRLETDASDFATGAVLSIQKDDKWHPVTFSSHTMSPEERNYLVADKEMLSVIRALEQWCHYLEGAKHQFDIWNDHANLQWFMKRQDLNRRQARWAQYLSRFSFLWSHKAGSTMGKADALSRREDHTVGIADDNKGVTVISPSQVRSLPIIDDIKKRIFDALVTRTETEVYCLCKEKGICEEHDGFLYDSSGRMYVPDDDSLRMHIISSHHDSPIAGHPGYQKTQELIERQYYWPGLASSVRTYVAQCDHCACFKGSNTKPAGSAVPLQPSTMPWVDVSADFITDLPLSNGFDSILTVVDRFSKETEFIPCNKTATALDTTKLYLFHIWKDHGLPRTIVSDRGPQFASQVMTDLCKRLSILPKLSTAHHPQTDGQTEVMNREVQQYLQLFCAEEQESWLDWLGLAQFTINNCQHSATKFSPFQLTWTYIPRMGVEHCASKAPAAVEFTDCLSRAYDNLVKAHSRILTQTNRSHLDAPLYSVRDRVWLSTDNLRLPHASWKLSERWLGPYSITKLIGTNAVKLRLPHSMRIHPVVNISHVKPYRDHLPGQPVSAPGPSNVTEDCEEEYEVEYIVDSWYKGKRLEYLIHWKGWSETDRTWEPVSNLGNAVDTVCDFHASHPSTPRRLRSISPFDFLQLFHHVGSSPPVTSLVPFDHLEVNP